MAHETTLAALAGPKFHALADRLALAPETLPGLAEAQAPATEALYPLVAHTFEVVERRVAALPHPRKQSAKSALADDVTDELWHPLRISAKRCPYPAEGFFPAAVLPSLSP